MSEIETEAPGTQPVSVDDLKAQIAALEAAKAAGQPAGTIDAMIASIQADIDAAEDATKPPAGNSATTGGVISTTFTGVGGPDGWPDSASVTVTVGDATFTGMVAKQ